MRDRRFADLQSKLLRAPDPSGDPLLPGLAPEEARRHPAWAPAHTTPAAVLVPLLASAPTPRILLTKRAADLKHHAGQIAFPGGRCETGETAQATALREAFEECGVPSGAVRVLGFLPDCVVRTGFRITPVIGLIEAQLDWVIDAAEVAQWMEIPIERLCDRRTHHRRTRSVAGVDVELIELEYDGHVIWGATAGILMTLVGLLEQVGFGPGQAKSSINSDGRRQTGGSTTP